MERYYFYVDKSGSQCGPLSLKQLIAENISLSTMIWHEGLSDWQSVGQTAEVCDELNLANVSNKPPRTPPTDYAPLYNVQPPTYERQRVIVMERPKKWVVEAVLVTIFCCMPMGIVALIFALRAEDMWSRGLHEEALSASQSAGTWVRVSLFSVVILPLLWGFLIMMGLLPAMFF